MMKWGSSVLHIGGFGYIFVLHLVDEDPREVVRRHAEGEDAAVGGPYSTIEEAKAAGSAALTAAAQRLNAAGFKASRPAKA